MKIAFIASRSDVAQDALTALSARYGNVTREEAEVIVVGAGPNGLRTLAELRAQGINALGLEQVQILTCGSRRHG